MTVLANVATVCGIAMALAGIPQVHRLYARKSASDISAFTYSAYVFGGIVWILYGVEISNTAIIASSSISLVISCLILVGRLLYGKSNASQVGKRGILGVLTSLIPKGRI